MDYWRVGAGDVGFPLKYYWRGGCPPPPLPTPMIPQTLHVYELPNILLAMILKKKKKRKKGNRRIALSGRVPIYLIIN